MPNVGDQHITNGAGQINNPFGDEQPRISEYTAQEIATLSSRLEKQLGPEYISTRQGPGGKPVHYLAAEKSITLANEVFGFNGWSSSIRQIQMDFVDVTGEKVSCGLHAIVRVTLRDGTYHEDVGYGHMENAKGKAQAFEKAKKEATTDALKRALRSFGNLLGNCVYDKDYLQRVTKVKAPPTKWDVDNLHRHSDFVPTKKEPGTENGRTTRPVTERLHGIHEDEFGSDDFDEVDFAVPEADETDGIEGTSTMPAPRFQRRSSLASAKEPPKQPTSHGQRHQLSTTSPAPAATNLHTSMHPIQPDVSTGRRETPANSVQKSHRTPSNAAVVNPPPQLSAQSNQHHPQPRSFDLPKDVLSTGARDPPIGFYTARAAETLQSNPTSAAVFNPHLESPSIRKTAGIDHTKTRPINRDILGQSPHVSMANGGVQNVSGISVAGNAGYQSPAGRKVGMPGGGIASLPQNRGSYKPPQMLKRPAVDEGSRSALGDVTNTGVANQGGSAMDAKKARLNGQDAENGPGALHP